MYEPDEPLSHQARVRGALLGGAIGGDGEPMLRAAQAIVAGQPLDLLLDGDGPAVNTTNDCTGLLCAPPFGLLLTGAGADDTVALTRVYELAYGNAAATNGHPTAKIAAGALAMLVARLCAGAELRAAVIATATHVGLKPGADDVIDAVGAALGATYGHAPPLRTVAALGSGADADDALAIALYAALVHSGPDEVADALALATSHPGGAATTGAICGTILGTFHGEPALPPDLLARLTWRAEIEATADALAAVAVDHRPGM